MESCQHRIPLGRLSISDNISIPVSSPTTEIRTTSAIKPRQTMRGHTGTVRGVAHLPDERHIITCSDDASLRVWDTESGAQIGDDWREEIDRNKAGVISMALSPNGKILASGSADGTVRLWDAKTRKVLATWTVHTLAVWSVCWSADGEQVVSASADGTIRVWDVESGETILGPIKTGHKTVSAMIYTPDTTKLATGGWSPNENAVKIWEANTAELLSTLKHEDAVWSLAWTSDGKKLISGSNDGSIRIFDTAKWQQVAVLEGHGDAVYTITPFQNDHLLASASDRTARLWNLDTNIPVGPPLQHQDIVSCAAISADGKLLVTGCRDNNAYIWDINAMLTETGSEDFLSIPHVSRNISYSTPLIISAFVPQNGLEQKVVAGKSLIDTDGVQRPAQLEDARRLPQGFLDDTQDGVHSSVTGSHLHSTVHPHHAIATSSGSGARTLLGRLSPRFCRSHPNTDEATEPHQRPRTVVVSGNETYILEAAGRVQDSQTLYVARPQERPSDYAKRIKNPTWWTRCVLFMCCVSPQDTDDD